MNYIEVFSMRSWDLVADRFVYWPFKVTREAAERRTCLPGGDRRKCEIIEGSGQMVPSRSVNVFGRYCSLSKS
jgi:hypothetical protein